MSVDREPTRLMRLGDQAEAAATARSRGRYPRPEDDLSRLDWLDRDPSSAPRVPDWWMALGLILAALVLLGIVLAMGVLR